MPASSSQRGFAVDGISLLGICFWVKAVEIAGGPTGDGKNK
jgi:hypothetical protein